MVIWLIGLSGAGKTTIGREVYQLWKARAANTVFVDGDEVRRMFGADRSDDDYTVAGRRRNAERISAICEWLDKQGINVVACVLSLFQDNRDWNRLAYSSYFEVFIDVPMEVLRRRHPRGLYDLAINGQMKNVVGVDIQFVPPASPHMVVNNGPDGLDAQAVADSILKAANIGAGGSIMPCL